MPWVRDKKWRQRGVGIKIDDPRQACYFDPANEGLVNVQYKQVVDRLLSHPNDFEIAWEHHGIRFDAQGKVIDPETPPLLLSSVTPIEDELPKPKRGRPKKG